MLQRLIIGASGVKAEKLYIKGRRKFLFQLLLRNTERLAFVLSVFQRILAQQQTLSQLCDAGFGIDGGEYLHGLLILLDRTDIIGGAFFQKISRKFGVYKWRINGDIEGLLLVDHGKGTENSGKRSGI